MKTKIILATLALTLAPTMTFAMGCNKDHVKEDLAISCAAGTTFDDATKACVPTTG